MHRLQAEEPDDTASKANQAGYKSAIYRSDVLVEQIREQLKSRQAVACPPLISSCMSRTDPGKLPRDYHVIRDDVSEKST